MSHRIIKPVRVAFTLIELMIVIGILALLISILLPSLNAAREFGRRTKCAANLHNIGLAFHHYSNDNEGHFPRLPHAAPWYNNIGYMPTVAITEANPSDNRGQLRSIFLLIRLKYLVPEQLICPSTNDIAVPESEAQTNWDFTKYDQISYSYQNQWDFSTKLTDKNTLPVMADRNPQMEWFWNSTRWSARQVTLLDTSALVDPTEILSANSLNHGGVGQNVLMLGGQVRWYSTPLAGLSIDGTMDNIYTKFDGSAYGATHVYNGSTFAAGPYDRRDSWLVP